MESSLSFPFPLPLRLSLLCRLDLKTEEVTQGGSHWLVQMKKTTYWKQLVVILAVGAVISLGIAVLTAAASTAWSVHNHNEQAQRIFELSQKMCKQDQKITELTLRVSEQDQKIAEQEQKISELQLEQQTKLSDGHLLELLRQCEGNATCKISELEDEMRQLKEDLDTLETTKVNRTELNSLSSDVSDLRETVSTKASKEDVLNLTADVRATALNYDQLQSEIDMLKWSKVGWMDFDNLVSNVTSLSATTVKLTTFETLNDTVQSLTTNKANQTSLDHLKTRVNQLDESTAKQQDLDSLDGRVSSHISSSQQTHNQHNSRISGNDHNIQSNTARIKSVEDDIQQLKDSTPGLIASWTVMIGSTAVFLVYIKLL